MMADFWMLMRENLMKGKSVKEIYYIGRSKIKRFAKARDLKEKSKHTLLERYFTYEVIFSLNLQLRFLNLLLLNFQNHGVEDLLLKI